MGQNYLEEEIKNIIYCLYDFKAQQQQQKTIKTPWPYICYIIVFTELGFDIIS